VLLCFFVAMTLKTKALCPTCNLSFSFWRVAFALSPYHLYCKNCRWRIVMNPAWGWAAWAAFIIISLILIRFVRPGDWSRLLVLGVLWVVFFLIIEIIVSLLIVNMAQFSKLDDEAV
jgi:hypothetical protein